MFNRQPFNRGRFNTSPPSGSASGTGILTMGVQTEGECYLVLDAGETQAQMVMDVDGSWLRKLYAGASTVQLILGVTGDYVRKNYVSQVSSAELSLGITGQPSVYGYAKIELPGVTVNPGSELIIDTEEMTVKLNGQDITRYFSPESEFFKLKPGDNIIVYEDNTGSRKVEWKILWKDRWL